MIQAHRESCDPENPRDYIDTYITRMDEERKVNPNSTFSGKTIGGLSGGCQGNVVAPSGKSFIHLRRSLQPHKCKTLTGSFDS